MAVRHDALGNRYDDRFVCCWHIYRDAEGTPTHMGWCGLDCPVRRYRPHPQWDAMRGGAA